MYSAFCTLQGQSVRNEIITSSNIVIKWKEEEGEEKGEGGAERGGEREEGKKEEKELGERRRRYYIVPLII